jgi:hypothetical protein
LTLATLNELTSRGVVAVVGIALLGCATSSLDDRERREPARFVPVIGEPADFKTRPGSYQGYDVVQCWDTSCRGIVGTGRSWPPGMERHPGHDDAVYQRSFQTFRAELTAAVKPDVPSLDTSGLSRSCGSEGIETVLWLHNWRELDAALASAGRFLRGRDLKERVSFCVKPHSPSVED